MSEQTTGGEQSLLQEVKQDMRMGWRFMLGLMIITELLIPRLIGKAPNEPYQVPEVDCSTPGSCIDIPSSAAMSQALGNPRFELIPVEQSTEEPTSTGLSR